MKRPPAWQGIEWQQLASINFADESWALDLGHRWRAVLSKHTTTSTGIRSSWLADLQYNGNGWRTLYVERDIERTPENGYSGSQQIWAPTFDEAFALLRAEVTHLRLLLEIL